MELLIVTGLSGAGKSLCLHRLEDMGYYCTDNLPSALLASFVKLCSSANPPVKRAAISLDSRENILKSDFTGVLDFLESTFVKTKIIFLDCREDVIVRRYNETRRRHPLAVDGFVQEAVRREKDMLASLRFRANHVIDTTMLKPWNLYEQLYAALGFDDTNTTLLQFMSFGFKRGMPIDADLVFDLRFLPNPFYEKDLREKSGLDDKVRDFVFEDASLGAYLQACETIINSTLDGYRIQGKQRLQVAFGCTGGRHRSVAVAEEAAARYKKREKVRCFHRDLILEEKDIIMRFGAKEEISKGEDKP